MIISTSHTHLIILYCNYSGRIVDRSVYIKRTNKAIKLSKIESPQTVNLVRLYPSARYVKGYKTDMIMNGILLYYYPTFSPYRYKTYFSDPLAN